MISKHLNIVGVTHCIDDKKPSVTLCGRKRRPDAHPLMNFLAIIDCVECQVKFNEWKTKEAEAIKEKTEA